MSLKISQLDLASFVQAVVQNKPRSFVIFTILFFCALSFFSWFLTVAKQGNFEDIERLDADVVAGEYIFNAAGCSGCHMSEGNSDRNRLAGGKAFQTAFGKFYAPNISMSLEYGIGDWSLNNFVNAVRKGVSPENEHYYPSFPYTSYNKITDQDLANLWAYWQTLPAIEIDNKAHDIIFPFSIRRPIGFWKSAFMSDRWVADESFDRGRYLVEAVGHCAECHTPRNAIGGLKKQRWLHGGKNPSGSGTIPNITISTLDWSVEEIEEYLSTGFTPDFDMVGGHMAEVIESTEKLSYVDRIAIANYIKSFHISAPQ